MIGPIHQDRHYGQDDALRRDRASWRGGQSTVSTYSTFQMFMHWPWLPDLTCAEMLSVITCCWVIFSGSDLGGSSCAALSAA